MALYRICRRRPAAGLHGRRGQPAVSRDFDAIIVGSGPGGSTAADVLTAAGWSVLIFERGKNYLVNTEKPSELLYEFSNDEIKFWSRHFLGPDPWLEPRTFRVNPSDGDRTHVGE